MGVVNISFRNVIASQETWYSEFTVMRYSAARSGLLKAALIARTTSSRGNPISIKLETALSYAAPVASVEASKLEVAAVVVDAGVDAGATGAAGVDVVAGFDSVEDVAGAAGAGAEVVLALG